MTTGANTDEVHLTGVDVDRDITVGQWADLREVTARASRARGAARRWSSIRPIEVGHIFKLGRKFTTALGVTVLGPDGSTVTPIMGSYGIGVERADRGHRRGAPRRRGPDLAGCRSRRPRSACCCCPCATRRPGPPPRCCTRACSTAGVDAAIDDRDVRPGVKYADAELTGIPFRISVGSRDLADGLVEITSRATGEKERVPVADAVPHLRALLGK